MPVIGHTGGLAERQSECAGPWDVHVANGALFEQGVTNQLLVIGRLPDGCESAVSEGAGTGRAVRAYGTCEPAQFLTNSEASSKVLKSAIDGRLSS